MRLKDKVVVVTGAGGGIGEATAKLFAREGAKVVGCARNLERLNKVVAEILEAGGEAIAVQADVSKKEDVDKLFQTVLEKYGRVDVLVNNAGITADARLMNMNEEQFDKVIGINLKGVFFCGQAATKIMSTQETGGVILNATSLVGIYGNYGQTNYVASKAGVIGMTKTWAKELGGKKIRVNAVAPGYIVTPMTNKIPQNVANMMIEKIPLKTPGYPEDIASAYAFLASDEARFITGTVLSVDGGMVL